MANLVVDIGNTQTKLAIFNGEKMLSFDHVAEADESLIAALIGKHKVDKVIISSVKENKPAYIQQLDIPVTCFTNQTKTAVNNHYQSANTLGADRWAAVAGAVTVNPGKDTLVIDAGTCITYDMVDAGHNYYGGSISPGLEMRYKAVNHYTAALPLLNADNKFEGSFGTDTASAIRSGIQNGIKYEAEGFISGYREQYPELNIILTGGDGIFLDTLLKNSIFAPYIKNDPYLVLKGLNAVIQVQND
ncbi:type III pantothenate kinase [Mucilaginibacter ginkgonis]|uniref:Type III pantothenate kinase n=1 Tax=Mucilaginibacter ginkgonis TaxID=2682091 RepID=A0A6I4I427_9SPHI|nr:type III pantothenate kinase [Mucilaginibacter ginkgonis]QQL48812.1 type III pantothenate kinase [Mucilaginibacter ginkgonis]